MTLAEMKTCAAETLSYFIQTMPDVPFTENDIVIEFAKRKDMADRVKALCAIYVPDKIINESQTAQLNESITANALTGRDKSAVIACINHKIDRQRWRMIFFHEFTHIFCAKREIDGEHFIDIYGSGHTPDENPDNKIRDGHLNSGYFVWLEFIAQYYALIKTANRAYDFAEADSFIFDLLSDVTAINLELSKGSFAQACAYWLTCRDAKETIDGLDNLDDPDYIIPKSVKYSAETKVALHDCLEYLHTQTKREKPWKISEDFIESLGAKFNMFRVMNNFYGCR
jgi:hypothetical protein